MLEEIKQLPHKVIKALDVDVNHLKVYLVQDFNLKLLHRMVEFGINIFGELGMDEWGLVPQIRHGNVYLLKEEDKKQIIGLAILMRDWENYRTAYLFDYAISDDFRGKGLGYEFLKIIAENLIEQDFNKINLTVDVDNEAAIKLYRDKIGFESILYKKNEYGEGHNRYVMELDLEDFITEQSEQ
jgi:[ribosomal protein S18]-alanine N-acetyltransferase